MLSPLSELESEATTSGNDTYDLSALSKLTAGEFQRMFEHDYPSSSADLSKDKDRVEQEEEDSEFASFYRGIIHSEQDAEAEEDSCVSEHKNPQATAIAAARQKISKTLCCASYVNALDEALPEGPHSISRFKSRLALSYTLLQEADDCRARLETENETMKVVVDHLTNTVAELEERSIASINEKSQNIEELEQKVEQLETDFECKTLIIETMTAQLEDQEKQIHAYHIDITRGGDFGVARQKQADARERELTRKHHLDVRELQSKHAELVSSLQAVIDELSSELHDKNEQVKDVSSRAGKLMKAKFSVEKQLQVATAAAAAETDAYRARIRELEGTLKNVQQQVTTVKTVQHHMERSTNDADTVGFWKKKCQELKETTVNQQDVMSRLYLKLRTNSGQFKNSATIGQGLQSEVKIKQLTQELGERIMLFLMPTLTVVFRASVSRVLM
eukprot:SAG31_NODE_2051_length_6559_cov_370.073684_1_plen_448_part_00